MTKKHFIDLADAVRSLPQKIGEKNSEIVYQTLAQFCRGQNYKFKEGRWIGYIKQQCGKNGGKIK